MTFHLMFVHICFSLVWVAEWPSFGKELLTRLTICSVWWFFYPLEWSRFKYGVVYLRMFPTRNSVLQDSVLGF